MANFKLEKDNQEANDVADWIPLNKIFKDCSNDSALRKFDSCRYLCELCFLSTVGKDSSLSRLDFKVFVCGTFSGISSDKRRYAIPAILNRKSRLKILDPTSSLKIALTAFNVVPICFTSENDSLVGKFEQYPGNDVMYEWGSWPSSGNFSARESATALSGVKNGVYIEIDDMIIVKEMERETRILAKGSGSHDSGTSFNFEIRSVGPVLHCEGVEPCFITECVTLNNKDLDESFSSRDISTLMFVGRSLIDWNPCLQPGDLVTAVNPEVSKCCNIAPETKSRNFHYVVNAGLGQVSRLASRLCYAAGNKKNDHSVCFGDEDIIECYEGRISRRVGFRIIEMDNNPRLKVFFLREPDLDSSFGLRVGTRIRFYNVLIIRVEGKLRGLGLNSRSSYEVIDFFSTIKNYQRVEDRLAFSSKMCLVYPNMPNSDLFSTPFPLIYWLLESIGILGLKFGEQSVASRHCERIFDGLQNLRRKAYGLLAEYRKEEYGLESAYESSRCEFFSCILRKQTDQMTRAVGRMPFMLTVGDVIDALQKKIRAGSWFLNSVSNRNGICDAPNYSGASAWSNCISSSELFPHRECVCLLGVITTSPNTGQLLLEDKTGFIELNIGVDETSRYSLLQTLRSSSVNSAHLALSEFRVVTEVISFGGSDYKWSNMNFRRMSTPNGLSSLWDSHFILKGPKPALVRLYVEPLSSSSSYCVDFLNFCGFERRLHAPTDDLGEYFSLSGRLLKKPFSYRSEPGKYGLFGDIELWNERLGLVFLRLDCSSKQSTVFPQYFSCAQVGDMVAFEKLKRIPAAAKLEKEVFKICKESRFFFSSEKYLQCHHAKDALGFIGHNEKHFKKDFCRQDLSKLQEALYPPYSVEELYSLDPYSLTSNWSFEAVVVSLKLLKGSDWKIPSTDTLPDADRDFFDNLRSYSLCLELKDCNSFQTVLCYLSKLGLFHCPAGLLRLGSRIVLRNSKMVKDSKRGLYCKLCPESVVEVRSVVCTGRQKFELRSAISSNHVNGSMTSLSSVLANFLESPDMVQFAKIRFEVVDLRFARFFKVCICCGVEVKVENCCPTTKSPLSAFLLGVKLECVIEDGTAQAVLLSNGWVAAQLLGADEENRDKNSTWNRINRIMDKAEGCCNMQYEAGKVRYAKEKSAEDPSLQELLEDVLLAHRCSTYQTFHAIVKFHSNVRKRPSDLKVSPFQSGKDYRRSILLNDKVSVQTSTLPRCVLVPLAVSQEFLPSDAFE